jgi:mono/diheme cytochrome c family protein
MKNIVAFLAVVFTVVLLFGFTFSINEYDDPTGKQIFVDKKCTTCHTVNSQDITSKKKDAADLSEAGEAGNAEFMAKYLNKKEKIDGKEHKTAFKGTEKELQTLSEWLVSLKTEKKK